MMARKRVRVQWADGMELIGLEMMGTELESDVLDVINSTVQVKQQVLGKLQLRGRT